jgi:hypothetical protein
MTVDAFGAGFDAPVVQTLGMGALAGVFAILTAFAAKPAGNRNDASFISKKQSAPPAIDRSPGAGSPR